MTLCALVLAITDNTADFVSVIGVTELLHMDNDTKRRVEILAKSPIGVLAVLSPKLQGTALTVLLKQHNASVAKDILIKKLQGLEISLAEYKSKDGLPGEAIEKVQNQVNALRFALSLPLANPSIPSVAFVSVSGLKMILQMYIAVSKSTFNWVPAAVSSLQPKRAGDASPYIKRKFS
jgi:hypothetical protein